MFGGIFEVFEIMCRFEFEICLSGNPFGSKRVGKVGICMAIFKVYEIKCRVGFLVQKYSGPYLRFMKSCVALS